MKTFNTRFLPGRSPHLHFNRPSITEQSHKREVDINAIISRYRRTGVLGTQTQVREMFYGDFLEVTDYASAMTAIVNAQERFMELPSAVRAEFANDPGKLLAALKDDSQLQRLVDLGIVKKPDPVVATPVNPDQPIDQNKPAVQHPAQSQTS